MLGMLLSCLAIAILARTICEEEPAVCHGNYTETSLNLRSKSLTGTIPTEIGLLENLIDLNFGDNQLNHALSGTIPPEIGKLENLETLSLTQTRPRSSSDSPGATPISGTIPPEIGNLKKLTSLNLFMNRLSGTIPPEIGELTNLRGQLKLRDNYITGTIPPEISKLVNLATMHLHINALSGSIPTEIGKLESVTALSLYRNRLTGPIPPEIGELENLQTLDLYSNRLGGTIPTQIGKLTNLRSQLHLNYNSITGTIPPEIGKLVNTGIMKLAGNSLSGTIPPELGELSALKKLYLNSNMLSGTMTSSLLNLTALESCSLSGNLFACPLPFGYNTAYENHACAGAVGVSSLELCNYPEPPHLPPSPSPPPPSPPPPSPSPPPPSPPPPSTPPPMWCFNTCELPPSDIGCAAVDQQYVANGACQDGGDGSHYATSGEPPMCAFGTDCADCGPRYMAPPQPPAEPSSPPPSPPACDHFFDGASTADEGKPVCMRTEESKLEPGQRVNVCRPATLPEDVDPLAVTDVEALSLHLQRLPGQWDACPSDMILTIARHEAPPLTPCGCTKYASAVAPVMCAKTVAKTRVTKAKVVCYATEAAYPAAYPRAGLEEGGALSWHRCRSDMAVCCTDCA